MRNSRSTAARTRWGCAINRADANLLTAALLAAVLLLTLSGCAREPAPEPFDPVTRNWLRPVLETPPVASADDAADDPAIWVDPEVPRRSLVLGTNKDAGLHVYDLDGRQRQFLPAGNVNNVDLRRRPWREPDLSVAVASHRDPSAVVVFTLDHTSLEVREARRIAVDLTEPYGICLYQDADAQPWVILNDKDGTFVQYRLERDYALTEARRFRTASQPEGCVADDAGGVLYVGEEAAGIWKLDADPAAPAELTPFARVGDGVLAADVEGLALYRSGGRTWLLASSQGDNSFAVYDTASGTFRTSFHVGRDAGVDDVSETDGIEVASTALPGFPRGLLVVQDGYNDRPRGNQNFKYVSLADLARLLAD